jgi:hypothetical protein
MAADNLAAPPVIIPYAGQLLEEEFDKTLDEESSLLKSHCI